MLTSGPAAHAASDSYVELRRRAEELKRLGQDGAAQKALKAASVALAK